MMLVSKPYMKITKDQLCISRKPEVISWFLFIGNGFNISFVYLLTALHPMTDHDFTIIPAIILVSSILFHFLRKGFFVLSILVLGEILLGLDLLGEWEEIIFDKTQNSVLLIKYSWCENLLHRTPRKSVPRIKLSDIRHVGISRKLGLFILPRNGKALTFNTDDLKRNEILYMKREITLFLYPSRVDLLQRNYPDFSTSLSNTSESEQYLESLIDKCTRDSSSRDVLSSPPMSRKMDTRVANSKQNQSTPSLWIHSKTGIDSEKHPKKRPYGRSIFPNIPSLQYNLKKWIYAK